MCELYVLFVLFWMCLSRDGIAVAYSNMLGAACIVRGGMIPLSTMLK